MTTHRVRADGSRRSPASSSSRQWRYFLPAPTESIAYGIEDQDRGTRRPAATLTFSQLKYLAANPVMDYRDEVYFKSAPEKEVPFPIEEFRDRLTRIRCRM